MAVAAIGHGTTGSQTEECCCMILAIMIFRTLINTFAVNN